MKSLLAQEYLRELHVVRQVSQHTIAAYTKDLDYDLFLSDDNRRRNQNRIFQIKFKKFFLTHIINY